MGSERGDLPGSGGPTQNQPQNPKEGEDQHPQNPEQKKTNGSPPNHENQPKQTPQHSEEENLDAGNLEHPSKTTTGSQPPNTNPEDDDVVRAAPRSHEEQQRAIQRALLQDRQTTGVETAFPDVEEQVRRLSRGTAHELGSERGDDLVRYSIGFTDAIFNNYNEAKNNYLEEQLEAKGVNLRDPKAFAALPPEARSNLIYEAKKVGQNAVRDLIESYLRAQEEDDADVKQNEQEQLRAAINTAIVDDKFRYELATRVQARALAHMGAFTAKYLGTEAMAGVVNGFNSYHVRELLNTVGVEKALDVLEEPDQYGVEGAFYRSFKHEGPLDANDPVVKAMQAEAPILKKDDDWIRDELWLVNHKFKLIEAARKDPNNPHLKLSHLNEFKDQDELIRLAIFRVNQTNPSVSWKNTAKTALLEIVKPKEELPQNIKDLYRQTAIKAGLLDEQGNIIPQKYQQFEALLYETDRAINIANKIHHTFGMSAMWDGPRWKPGTKIPEEFWNDEMRKNKDLQTAGVNQLVVLNPTVPTGEWEVPSSREKDAYGKEIEGTGKIKRKINLRTIAKDSDKDPELKEVWGDIRKQKLVIAESWTRTYRNFYANHYQDIDLKNSATRGRAAREASRVINFPIVMSHRGEAHPGRPSLRRYAYLNVPSLLEFNSYRNTKEIIDNWGNDYPYMKIGWSTSRLTEAPKFKTLLHRENPKLLRSMSSLRDFVKALKEVKPQVEKYTTQKEAGEVMENLLRGVLLFRAQHSEEADLLNLGEERLKEMITEAQIEGIIGHSGHESIKEDMFGPRLLKKYQHAKPFGFLKKIIGGLADFEPLNKETYPGKVIWGLERWGKDMSSFISQLWWGRGFLAGLWEFIKQSFTLPK